MKKKLVSRSLPLHILAVFSTVAVHACVSPILELSRFWIFCVLFQVVFSSSIETHFIIWLDSCPWYFRLPAFTIPFVVTSWAFLLFSTGNGVVVRFSSIHIRNQYRHCQTLNFFYKSITTRQWETAARVADVRGCHQKSHFETSGQRALWRRNSGLLPWGKSRTRRLRRLSGLLQVRTRLHSNQPKIR